MQNLKITFTMSAPVIIDRTTTIDGILLSAYYSYMSSKGTNIPFDKEHRGIEFIDKRKGVFSGSIWYVDKDEDVVFDFETFVKKSEYRNIFTATGKRKNTDATFKAYMGTEETMIVDNIYFYICGDKRTIKSLLEAKVFGLGKKQSIGFGAVKNIDVQEIKEDKGFMINPTTVSKPLPIKDFGVNSKKISQMRKMPPYWLDEDLEPCYMPTTSLCESTDNSFMNTDFNYVDIPYEHNCDFLYAQGHSSKCKKDEDLILKSVTMEKVHKAVNIRNGGRKWEENNTTLSCSITKKIGLSGVKGNTREFTKYWKQSFGDYGYFSHNNFLSLEAIWCIDNIAEVAYSYVDTSKWLFLQGKRAKEGSKYKDYLKNPEMLKSPFSINLKDTQNAQHISFKGKVSISNAFFTIQYGNTQLQIDNELLQQAIVEIDEIIREKKITKTHLCGMFDKNKSTHPAIKKDFDNPRNNKLIMNFQKKYNTHIRFLLSSVRLD